MAIDYNEVADRVFDQLKGFGVSIIVYDDSGKQTLDSATGRYFYSKDQKFTVQLDDKNNLIKIKYGESADTGKMKQIINSIRNGIAKKFLIGVDVMPYTGKDIELKHVEQMVKEAFSPATGSMKTSYQATDGAKLIIRHSKPVNEEIRGSRSRNIQALFIENSQGERFKYPQNHLLAAKIMTKHVAEGGTPYDEIGQKIVGLSEERAQLLKVSGYIKSQGLQEQANDVQHAVAQRLNEIKGLLGRYAPDKLMSDVHEADETDLEALQEKLTKNIFDETIGNLLPKLNGYVKEYKIQQEAAQEFQSLKQQVEEADTIQVRAIPDLDMISMMVYESPTINTTELINLVLPVLEDENVERSLTKLSHYVQEGKLDAMEVENLTRSIIGKSVVAEYSMNRSNDIDVFESALAKYRLEQILK